METITLPAYAGDTLGETITLHAPAEWHERIKALAPYLTFGPEYQRYVLYSLRRMSDALRSGYSSVAYDWLLHAELLVSGQ